MFSKSKSGTRLLENNPILNHYEVGRPYASGGPEGIWKIYEGYSKSDKRVRSFYVLSYSHIWIGQFLKSLHTQHMNTGIAVVKTMKYLQFFLSKAVDCKVCYDSMDWPQNQWEWIIWK